MDLIKKSKQLAFTLRHDVEAIKSGLVDKNGWADRTQIEKMLGISSSDLDQIVKDDDKQRYIFSDDKTKIRASQGHSTNIELNLEQKRPPDVLYHGTATRFWDSIDKIGLVKGTRQYVHLSLDKETATKVGQRHGKPLILTIDAKAMYENGYKFYLSANNVWLTENVPRKFITYEPLKELFDMIEKS